MLCSLIKPIFPRNGQEKEDGFSIMQYVCNEHLKDCDLAISDDGSDLYGEYFSAKGYFLPRSTACQYDLQGHWETNKKMSGKTFVVENITEVVAKNQGAIIDFLNAILKGSGVGPATVKKMYEAFGNDLLDIIEKEPNKLSDVKGIKQAKVDSIVTAYGKYRGARDVMITLTPLGISQKICNKIYETYKDEAISIIHEHPYQLCRFRNISFKIADIIAQKSGLSANNPERVEAAILEVLFQAEYGGDQFRMNTGHLCVEYGELIRKANNVLGHTVDNATVVEAYKSLYSKNQIVCRWDFEKKDKAYVYRKEVDEVETKLAQAIVNIAKFPKMPIREIESDIRLMEIQEKVSLAPEQRNAVITGLSNQFAVITGGPGTGKTTIIKFIRNIYMKRNKGKKILMCSPTGVAATRMSDSTNGEACTIHKSLGLVANEEGVYNDVSVPELDYDLIIVDETSMMDIYLAKVLCEAVQKGAKLLFIGDVDQLPSVGPGAVLKDIIDSHILPVAVLTKVYRQADGSLIALNALLIKNGKYSFDYGEAFQFIPADNFDTAARIMEDLYLKEISANGIQNVMMLSPFRKKTATGVNSLNLLRDNINPPDPNKKEIESLGRLFREGDKVIQLKNVDSVSNGETGMITRIAPDDEGTLIVNIDFGHDRVVNYKQEDLEMIDWSYAMTVHKSQGSEANVVIFNLLDEHGIMLKRNLLYTAITRAKKKVYIIGSMSAIQTAVLSGESNEDRRNTLLSSKIRFFMKQEKAA